MFNYISVSKSLTIINFHDNILSIKVLMTVKSSVQVFHIPKAWIHDLLTSTRAASGGRLTSSLRLPTMVSMKANGSSVAFH